MLRIFRGKKKTKQKESRVSLIFDQADADNREELEREIKTNKQRRQISLETKHKNFIAVVQWENEKC